jgi:hypothetical protein
MASIASGLEAIPRGVPVDTIGDEKSEVLMMKAKKKPAGFYWRRPMPAPAV